MPQVPTNNFDISGLSGIPGALVGAFQGERNLQFQKETQQTTWEREDNAVQRRVADLEEAGLNKVLAAGQPAQAGLTQAPQSQSDQQAMALMQMKANISKTEAEAKYTDTQAKVAESTLPGNLKSIDLNNLATNLQNEVFKKYGMSMDRS